MIFEEYKEGLLTYLRKEKKLTERDIQNHLDLSDEEKVEQGYLIKGCVVTANDEDCYEFTTTENNTKLRAGDRVLLKREDSKIKISATVVENFFNHISITTTSILDTKSTYDIHVTEAVFLDPVIKILEDMEEGTSGSYYLEELAMIEVPDKTGYSPIHPQQVTLPTRLNSAQKDAIEKVLLCPTLYCIQGPPGTGKTDVLSNIAQIFSEDGREVLIVSNTHQAVNNALNKMAGKNLPLVKIGETLKGQDLANGIALAKNYDAYLKTRSKWARNQKGDIVGMTLHAAIINLGLRKSGFLPSIVLADEAGQIPLAMGATIGKFGAGSIVFIGDDRQMPPIFHHDLANDPLSVSIFTHISRLYPDFKTVLDTTYRMNIEITEWVSKKFYEPHGIILKSFRQPALGNSIETISLSADSNWQEYNPEEAKVAAQKALEYHQKGMAVAVVTPFRKQVNCIREFIKDEFKKHDITETPLVDTVERLQGQDVDAIIISTSISDPDYYRQMRGFILEPHRLNVMVSRAKEKVIIIKSDIVKIE